jgi:hypothetical protein
MTFSDNLSKLALIRVIRRFLFAFYPSFIYELNIAIGSFVIHFGMIFFIPQTQMFLKDFVFPHPHGPMSSNRQSVFYTNKENLKCRSNTNPSFYIFVRTSVRSFVRVFDEKKNIFDQFLFSFIFRSPFDSSTNESENS